MVNNTSNKPVILVFELILVLLFISTIVFAIPNSLTIQGKLTNLGGTSQVGTFNFTFKIYDNVTGGNELWAVINQSVTTDSNGVYDTILTGLNLSFAEQYYLGIAVQGENESKPRINLTSAPYSFRANTSEALNPNASYFVRNLSVAGHATIGNGTSLLEISTQLFNFSLTTGNLNINGTVTAKSFVGDGSLLTGLAGSPFNASGTNVYLNDTTARLGLGMTTPTEKLRVEGNVSITGNLFINETLNFTASSGNLRIANNITLGDQIVFRLGEAIDNLVDGWLKITGALNVTSNLSVDVSTFFVDSLNNRIGVGTISPNDALEVVGSVRISGSLNATSINATGSAYLATSSGRVGIGTTTPGQALHVVGSANVSASVNAPVVNTTLATQNITISSAAGSVIIRLG